ncbi:MAG: DUF3090 family protein [Dehalococcoidia bacterium]
MIDFGLVDAVEAEAIGVPGQRTFRLRVRVGDRYASLWMEKESVAALGRSFSALLAERSRRRGQPPGPVQTVGNFPQRAEVELQVARLGLDWEDDPEQVVVLADDAESMERGESPSFRMALDRSLALRCVKQFQDVVNAGRPTCPLCHEALEYPAQPHFCPRSNGHNFEIPLPPREAE